MNGSRIALTETDYLNTFTRRPALAPVSNGGLVGLSAMAVLTVAMLVATEFVVPSTDLPQLSSTEPSPIGTWTCSFADGTTGVLTVTGWNYALATNHEQPEAGMLEPVGGRTAKNNSALLHVVSGPLKQDFGVRIGLYDDKAQSERLILNTGPGTGIRCNRL